MIVEKVGCLDEVVTETRVSNRREVSELIRRVNCEKMINGCREDARGTCVTCYWRRDSPELYNVTGGYDVEVMSTDEIHAKEDGCVL